MKKTMENPSNLALIIKERDETNNHEENTSSCIETLYFHSTRKKQKMYTKMKPDNLFVITVLFLSTLIPSNLSRKTTINPALIKNSIQQEVKLFSSPPSLPSTVTISNSSSTNKTEKSRSISHHLSTVAESGITFISVFIFGCVIMLSVYSWKKFSDSSWGYV
jgi:hypothetical protein